METLIDIVLPGDDNLSEATILTWLKSPGDSVNEHEPILEVSTDKVTIEVAAPATGILREISCAVDSVVFPGTVLGRIDQIALVEAPEQVLKTDEDYNADAVESADQGPRLSPLVRRILREHNLSATEVRGSGRDGRITHRDILAHLEGQDAFLENQQSSDDPDHYEDNEYAPNDDEADFPSSDEIANNSSPDEQALEGDSSEAESLYGFLDGRGIAPPTEASSEFENDLALVELSDCGPSQTDETAEADSTGGDQLDTGIQPFEFEKEVHERKPHSAMRRTIARHMVDSVRTAPHVTAVFDADMSRVMTHRELNKADADRRGVRLTYSSYFISAAVQALEAVPEVNSVWHDDGLDIIRHANIGIATALDAEGLVVPVLHNANELELIEIATRLQDLVGHARNGTLERADVSGGTFTITNHGVSGSIIATPIINQPQSAILGIGRLEKRVVVREYDGRDSIQVQPMIYVTLTIDHRVLDGFQANRFLSKFVDVLENWEFSQI